MSPSAGWYPDPVAGNENLRWWDGQQWTEHLQPRPIPFIAERSAPLAIEQPAEAEELTQINHQADEAQLLTQPRKSLKLSAWLARVSLMLTIVVSYGIILINDSISGYKDSGTALDESASGQDRLESFEAFMKNINAENELLLITLALFVITAVCFIAWFYRAYKNLEAQGYDLKYSTSSAIWAWLIPFFNFVRPKQITDDIWRGSSKKQISVDWRQRKVSPGVAIWWGLFILGGLVYNGVYRALVGSHDKLLSGELSPEQFQSTIETIHTLFLVETGVLTLNALSAVAAIWFINRVTKMQETV